MESMIDMTETYTGGSLNLALEFPEVYFRIFFNKYMDDFEDTNNLSLVKFLQCRNEKFIIPGDLEVTGWQSLLYQESFCHELADATVFIASHHGRENGYCEDVFH